MMNTYFAIIFHNQTQYGYANIEITNQLLSLKQYLGFQWKRPIQIDLSQINQIESRNFLGATTINLKYQDKTYILFENGLGVKEYLTDKLLKT